MAYSMGQSIKSVCVCQCVCLRALSRSHFLIDFHQNWLRCKYPQKEEQVHWGLISHHPFPYFVHKTSILGQEVLKIHANIYIHLNFTQITAIFTSVTKSRWRKTMVTSDFRLEVEIRLFCTCAMKNIYLLVAEICTSYKKSRSINAMVTSHLRAEGEYGYFVHAKCIRT